MNFDPNSYEQIPDPRYPIFEPNTHLSTDAHQAAEQQAREAIRAALSRKNGNKPVIAQWELVSRGWRNLDYQGIAEGRVIVR